MYNKTSISHQAHWLKQEEKKNLGGYQLIGFTTKALIVLVGPIHEKRRH